MAHPPGLTRSNRSVTIRGKFAGGGGMADHWPRQPRDGNPTNHSRVTQVSRVGPWKVQCKQTDGTYATVATIVTSESRANNIRDALNEIFDNHPGADLDFIHIYKGGPNAKYKVVWPTVTFQQAHSNWTRWSYSCGSGPTIKAWEEAYKHPDTAWPDGQLREIATVTQDDIDYTGKPPWRVAFMWANNIRNAVNGWNITQDAFYPPDESDNIPLFHSGTIVPFVGATDRSASSEHFNSACVYGFGECLITLFSRTRSSTAWT
jgi:hypothetical protein